MLSNPGGGGGTPMPYPQRPATTSPYIHAAGSWNSTPTPYIGANWNWWQNYQPTATTPAGPSSPDPSSWVESILGPLRAELAGQSAQDMASAKAGIKRALVSGGFDINAKDASKALGYKLPGGMFDERTRQLIAEGNKAGLTQNFRINQANDDARRAIINNLAARGIIRGGATGFQLGRQNTAYTQAQYGARQHILDTIAGIWGQYLQAERQRAMMLAQSGLSAGSGG